MFDYEWLTFLNFFPSVDLQMGSSLYIVKNQALIANYSMIGLKGCFIQCLSVIFFITIYSEGNLFVKDLFSQFIPFSMHLHHGKPLVILTTGSLQLPCYKHNVVISYLLACRINSLCLFIQNLCIRKVSHFKPQFGRSTKQN